MYYYLNGNLTVLEPGFAVIDCAGVGYRLNITFNTYKKLKGEISLSKLQKLYTYLNVKEDALDLFGFYDENELNSFKLLIGVSGVGPKAATAILSELSPEQFVLSIVTNDTKQLSRASGVGPKLASRIALELKDKIKSDQLKEFEGFNEADILTAGNLSEAVNALSVLGYTKAEASMAVKKTNLDDTAKVEDIIKNSLKQLMK